MSAPGAARGVVTIQSHVAYGHVGNAAAVFALQRLGHEAWPVNVLAFSNHPGHGHHAGTVHEPALVRDLVDGLERVGALAACSAVLTGYLPRPALVREAAAAVARVRALSPGAPVLCDPVIGDRETGRYVPDGVAEALRASLVPAADVLVPNLYELEVLAGTRVRDLEDAVGAAGALAGRAGARVVVTGVEPDAAHVAALLLDRSGTWLVRAPRVALGRRPDGAGDLLAAVLLARLLDGAPPPDALVHAMAAVHDVLALTHEHGARELALVAAQRRLVEPRARPRCERL